MTRNHCARPAITKISHVATISARLGEGRLDPNASKTMPVNMKAIQTNNDAGNASTII